MGGFYIDSGKIALVKQNLIVFFLTAKLFVMSFYFGSFVNLYIKKKSRFIFQVKQQQKKEMPSKNRKELLK